MLKRLTLALAMTGVLATQVQADEAARERLIDRLAATATLTADFTQETYGDGEMSQEKSEGHMKVARPLKFAWLVNQPYEQQVISDGETLWVYDPDLEQATYQPVGDQIQRSPAMILAQPESTLNNDYDVMEAGDDALTAYRLFPTDEDAVFNQMTLLFEQGEIREIRLKDNLGQTTLITFSNVKAGVEIDPGEFDFTPPPGTDVFEQM